MTAPKGLDTMSAEESALLASMRDGTAAPEGAADEPVEDLDDTAPDAVADTPADGRSRTVPHAQFHAANERRKQAEAKAAAAELKLATETARVQERIDLLMKAIQSAAPAEPAEPAVEVPDVAVDPVGHFKALLGQTQKTVADQAAILKGFQEQQEQSRAVNELREWGLAQERAFTQQAPDFYDAMTFMREGRHAELEAAGVVDQMARDRIIAGDITQIAMKSREDGANFAERLYRVAEKRGYAKRGAVAPVIPPLDAGTPLPDAAARAQRGRENSTTIATVGSVTPPALTPERIASMSDAAFNAWVEKARGNPAALRDVMGH